MVGLHISPPDRNRTQLRVLTLGSPPLPLHRFLLLLLVAAVVVVVVVGALLLEAAVDWGIKILLSLFPATHIQLLLARLEWLLTALAAGEIAIFARSLL